MPIYPTTSPGTPGSPMFLDDDGVVPQVDALKVVHRCNTVNLLDDSLSTPPASPREGDAYIVGASPAGGWAAFSQGDLVVYTGTAVAPNNTWVRTAPGSGGAPFANVRAIIGAFQGTPAGSFAGQAGNVATYAGGAWHFFTPVAGIILVIVGNGDPFEGAIAVWKRSTGAWVLTSSAPRIISATGSIGTSSTAAAGVLATGMSTPPMAGLYYVEFEGSSGNSLAAGDTQEFVGKTGAIADSSSTRHFLNLAGGRASFKATALVTVNGTDTIEGRWRVTSGAGTMLERQLTVWRVG